MLMYLTGMYANYWLTGDISSSSYKFYRRILMCGYGHDAFTSRYFWVNTGG